MQSRAVHGLCLSNERNILTLCASMRDGMIVMITSKLTSKAQTTIPQPVRIALHLHEGDEITYRIVENHVILTKALHEQGEDPFVLFSEWGSAADCRAYEQL